MFFGKVSNIVQTVVCRLPHHVAMKTKTLTAKQLAAVECPTCGAAVGEVCELNSGGPRFAPHLERELAAANAFRERWEFHHGEEKNW